MIYTLLITGICHFISLIVLIANIYLFYSDLLITFVPLRVKKTEKKYWTPGIDIITFCLLCYYETLIRNIKVSGKYRFTQLELEDKIVRIIPMISIGYMFLNYALYHYVIQNILISFTFSFLIRYYYTILIFRWI